MPLKGGILPKGLEVPFKASSFPNTGGASVSPCALSVAAHRQNTLSYSNSEAPIQFNKVSSAPYRYIKCTLLVTSESIGCTWLAIIAEDVIFSTHLAATHA